MGRAVESLVVENGRVEAAVQACRSIEGLINEAIVDVRCVLVVSAKTLFSF